jgi:hypothetical protein
MFDSTGTLGIRVELYINGAWVDISSDVRADQGVRISRGNDDWYSSITHSTCHLSIDNRTFAYSTRNPASAYYGLIGRNTRMRVSVYPAATATVYDAFGRTEASGWGTSDSGQSWTVTAGGSVSSGQGVITLSAAGDEFATMSPSLTDVEVLTDITMSVTTSGEAGVVARYSSDVTHYEFAVTTGGVLWIYKVTAGPTYTSLGSTSIAAASTYRMRAGVIGSTLKLKVWDILDSEPDDWNLTATDSTYTTGDIGCYMFGNNSGDAGHFDNFEARSVSAFTTAPTRFVGEISTWPPRRGVSGDDVLMQVEASDIIRRLGKDGVLRSDLYRTAITDANLRAYWPCEDGADATQIASGISGGYPMTFGPQAPTFDTDDFFFGSDKVATLGGETVLTGRVASYTATDQIGLRLLVTFPSGGLTDLTPVAKITQTGSGSVASWLLRYGTASSGSLRLEAIDADNVTVDSSGWIAFGLDGKQMMLSIKLAKNGSDVDWNLDGYVVSSDGTISQGGLNNTFTSLAVGIVTTVAVAPSGAMGTCVVGHIMLGDSTTFVSSLTDAIVGHIGETAGNRLYRLCGEESIDFTYTGTLGTTEKMGSQGIYSLVDLFQQCVDVDMGILYTPRYLFGIAYVTREALYAQTATLTLDYSTFDISEPFEPEDDDQLLRNDITVTRQNGSSARAELESGTLSTLSPPSGVGRYPDSVEIVAYADSQLLGIAQWRRHLGVWDEPRYAAVGVELHRAPFTADTSMRNNAADLDIGNLLALASLPSDLPPGTADTIVRGLNEMLTRFTWTTVPVTVPAGPYRVAELDTDRLDSGSSTLAASYSAVATSLSVATSDAADLWTTDVGEFPLDIVVSGERIRISAISGAASPQTFTVSARGVDGVAVALASGAEVHVYHPATLAL